LQWDKVKNAFYLTKHIVEKIFENGGKDGRRETEDGS
jgi:hypothetical protein